jgi:nitrate reductase molybdenum cofactor assembly chaperone NarJ/NarW
MYHFLAALLSYPGRDLLATLDDCILALAPDAPAAARLLERFRDTAKELGQGGLEEAYIQTFELHAGNALYIGHQLFGEDWRRGTFMARLKERYQELGLSIGEELPDHLSVMLRFLEVEQPGQERDELIGDCIVPALHKVLRAIEGKKSPYETVLSALLLCLSPRHDGETEFEDLSCRTSSLSLFPILP